MDNYYNNSIVNPKYLFHGSSKLLNVIEQRQAFDSNGTVENEDYTFPFDESYEHYGRSIQYKCHKNITPIDVVKIRFADFKEFYFINNKKTR